MPPKQLLSKKAPESQEKGIWSKATSVCDQPSFLKKKIFFEHLFIVERQREMQSVSREGAEREGDTESEASSRLWAVSTEPDVGLELTNCEIMT